MDAAILPCDLIEDLVHDACPALNEEPEALSQLARAIAPAIDALARAYLDACNTGTGRVVAQRFLENMLAAEG